MPTVNLILNAEDRSKPCFVCSGQTEDGILLAVIAEEDVIDEDRSYVCEECLTAGPKRFPTRLREKAARLRVLADELDKFAADPWTAPSIGEWADETIATERNRIAPGINPPFLDARETEIRAHVTYLRLKVD